MPILPFMSLEGFFSWSLDPLKLNGKLYICISEGSDYSFILILKSFCDPNKIRNYFGQCF